MDSPGDAPPIGSIILAGGRSRRMGFPKALLPVGSLTFLEKIASAYEAAGIGSILAVTHGGVAGDPGFPELAGVELLVLEEPTASPLHTLWRALDRIAGRWAAFFVHPVDHPFVEPKTVETMARIYQEERAKIVQARYRGKGGHPVLLDKDLEGEIRAASPDQGLRQVVRADPARVRQLAVEDPGILKGVNLPADLEGFGPEESQRDP